MKEYFIILNVTIILIIILSIMLMSKTREYFTSEQSETPACNQEQTSINLLAQYNTLNTKINKIEGNIQKISKMMMAMNKKINNNTADINNIHQSINMFQEEAEETLPGST